jgi:hypothetical protein
MSDRFELDYKTDEVIQSSLRQQLNSDTSLITVAHRLQTIMDADKIVSFCISLFGIVLPTQLGCAIYRWCLTLGKL